MATKLREKYTKEIIPALKEKFQYKSVMQVPSLQKICINRGVGKAAADKKLIDIAVEELGLISGQKPQVTYAKVSISNFKLREGMPIGARVTLRGDKMYEFLDRFVSIVLPRERDFKGVSDKSFDGRGNYTLGLKEQIIFPEIRIDTIKEISGMDITFVTSAPSDEEGYELLKLFGMPFKQAKK